MSKERIDWDNAYFEIGGVHFRMDLMTPRVLSQDRGLSAEKQIYEWVRDMDELERRNALELYATAILTLDRYKKS